MKQGHLDDALLHLSARHALSVGLSVLEEIAKAGPRYEESEIQGESRFTKKPISTDLDAAKALVQFGLKAKAMLVPKILPGSKSKEGDDVPCDLWDLANLGPWRELKDPNKQ